MNSDSYHKIMQLASVMTVGSVIGSWLVADDKMINATIPMMFAIAASLALILNMIMLYIEGRDDR